VAGLVIARQRPSTAGGTMFLLFEDEWGTINLIVPRVVYERHRPLARAEPLLLARGRLERAEGVINVLVRELAALEGFLDQTGRQLSEPAAAASVHDLPERSPAQEEPAAGPAADEQAADAQVGSSMRAVAPAVQSFAMGRRR
jgi:error-prone DNA polymerase